MNNDINYYDISLNEVKSPNAAMRRITSLTSLNEKSTGPGSYYIRKISQSQVSLPIKLNGPQNAAPVCSDMLKKSPKLQLETNSSEAKSRALKGNSSSSDTQSNLSDKSSENMSVKQSDSFKSLADLKNQTSSFFKGDQASFSSYSDESSTHSTFEPPIDGRLSSLTDESSPRSTIIEKEPTPSIKLQKSTSHAHSFVPLNRTKSKYISSQETKSRKLLRKQKYDDNDADDVIYDNDLPLVFNVPVIKNYGTLYLNNQDSDILRNHLLADSKYPNPTPLPGKLSQPNIIEQEEVLEDFNNTSSSSLYNISEDVEITKNIQQFYNHRTASQAKLLKSNRDSQMYKLPQFIKSQSSVEDLQLISPEKLNCIDQSRPINLPPKLINDKSKHQKQFQQVLTQYESNNKHLQDMRLKTTESVLQNQQSWQKVFDDLQSSGAKFTRRFERQKLTIRKLSWDCNIPSKIRFDLLRRFLIADDTSSKATAAINDQFELAKKKYESLNSTIKTTKDRQFDSIINQICARPLYESILKESDRCIVSFKSDFRYLLYMKSLADSGLQKHDEAFLIPLCLILFGNSQSLQDIYTFTELINHKVFAREFLSRLNEDLNKWGNERSIPYCVKDLSKFKSLKEFENLNCNRFWDILLQLNDTLPLSLSAPSTPILNQGSFALLSPNSSVANLSEDVTSDNNSPEEQEIDSCVLQLMIKLLQTLIIYSCSPKSKVKNNLKIIQTFSLIIFMYYHFNWNNFEELIKGNKSIKLNYNTDKVANLDSFVFKWKQYFK